MLLARLRKTKAITKKRTHIMKRLSGLALKSHRMKMTKSRHQNYTNICTAFTKLYSLIVQLFVRLGWVVVQSMHPRLIFKSCLNTLAVGSRSVNLSGCLGLARVL